MASIIKSAVKPLLPPCIHSQKVGVVVSAGKMIGAVKVRVAEQEWNKKFRKHFPAPKNYLVRDPNASLVPGDIVRITSGHRSSKAIHHVVTAIIAPFGQPVEKRPKVLTTEELDALRLKKRLAKDVRAAERGRQVSKARLRQARGQGLEIPSLEEAMKGLRMHEEEMKERGVGQGKAEKHKGQVGQQKTANASRVEAGKKLKEEKKAEEKVKRARKQQTS